MPNIDDPFLDELEPSAAQEGIDVPGSRSAFTDFINFGVYNGNFRVGPPQAASNLDVAGSTTGSNFLPGWRFVQSSNTTITARLVQDTYNVSPSGSNVRFTFTGQAIGDEAFIEQIIDIGGSARQDVGAVLRSYQQVVPGSTNVTIRTQYLDSNGSIVGMPPERSVAYTAGSITHPAEVDNPPSRARYLRVRVCAVATSTAIGSLIELTEVRRERVTANQRFVDRDGSGTGVSDIYQSGSNLLWAPASTLWGTTTTKRLLNYQLIPLTFTGVNIPANATTNLDIPGDAALNLATPRIGLPWASSVVGMSYRLSAVPTAGGTGALKLIVQVGGSNLWNPAFSINGSGGALSAETSVAPETYNVASGGQIGVVATTTATYAPTTAEIVVVVWLAVKYDGS